MRTESSSTLVLGAGAWGTAIALALVRNGSSDVYLWGRDEAAMKLLRETRVNDAYLPGIVLPGELKIISADDYPGNVDLVVSAIPFQQMRAVVSRVVSTVGRPQCIACASKGLEAETFLRADQVIAELVEDDTAFAMLSGPNFALEVAEQRPAAITVASKDPRWSRDIVGRLRSDVFRPYTSEDVIGVEIGGAIKNVMAIAAGIADGLDLGANSRAALITRGLAEITRFGILQGGQLETFMGLSGVGDLVLTCTDDKSRNRRFGLELAAGATVAQAIVHIGLVEGATTAAALVKLADKIGVDMPISRQVADTIAGVTTPRQAVKNLLSRNPVAESAGLMPSY